MLFYSNKHTNVLLINTFLALIERSKNMEFENIRSFICLAETLNFAKAAQREHVSQPTLSRRIQNLEKELDTVLFLRDSRNVCLTDAGKEFYFHSTKILEQYSLAVKVTKNASVGYHRQLRIGIGYYEQYILADFIGAFANKYPKIQINLYQFIYEKLLEHFSRGNLDIILTSDQFLSSVSDVNFKKELLWGEDWNLAMSKDNHLANINPIKRILLREQTLISMYSGNNNLIRNIYKNQDFSEPFNKIIQVNSYEGKLTLVNANLGIGFLPSFVLTKNYSNVVLKKLDPPYKPRKFYVLCNKYACDAVIQDFFDICLTSSKNLQKTL